MPKRKAPQPDLLTGKYNGKEILKKRRKVRERKIKMLHDWFGFLSGVEAE